MRRIEVLVSVIFLSAILGSSTAYAAVFPDVPLGHMYRDAIEMLTGEEIVNGNPDGNFYPSKSVNRAEILKMLYIAMQKEPRAVYANCFSDVENGSWYELYVCDAVNEGYIQGYSDGTFRPSNKVNRAEAIKMITNVFGFSVPDIGDEEREVVNFVDVSVSAWYTKYLYTAFTLGLLPIKGQEGPRFYPDWPLLRGEAAAYIWNALRVERGEIKSETRDPVELEDDTEEVLIPSLPPSLPKTSAASSAASSVSSAPKSMSSTFDVTFPFRGQRAFDGKKPHLYKFSPSRNIIMDLEVSIDAGYAGGISCRLYRLDSSGFSMEYYLGYTENDRCYLMTSLSPGNYQLQLQPTVGGTRYTLGTKDGSGDGNDGFRTAKRLSSIPLVVTLEANDLSDWYKFSVSSEKDMSVEIASQADLGCLIYPMEDVDLYGFSGPQCNQSYLYPSGTYYVGVSRAHPRSVRQTYTIRLK